jgi:hypothetical protein
VNGDEIDKADATEFRTENHPHCYRVDARTRRLLIGFGVCLTLFGVFMSALHLAGIMRTPLAAGDLYADAGFAGFAIWLGFLVSRHVVLYEDRVELVTWFSKRTLLREEILGRRMGNSGSKSRGGSFYILVPKDRQAAELRFPPLLRYDKYFWDWMRDIPQIMSR